MQSIYLPENTTVNLVSPGQDPVEAEMLDVEDVFVRAASEAVEKSTTQWTEAKKLFKKEYKLDISETSCALLWGALQTHLNDLKKNMLVASESSEKPVSKSSPRRKKK